MNEESSICCLGWQAFAPGLQSREQWGKWLSGESGYPLDECGKPPCKSVPPMIRRRCTDMTKMVAESFYRLADEHHIDIAGIDLVFASRHGEIAILESLLETMARGDELSPIDFCNSVHHTSTGYLSMASKNRRISRTVSAGDRTFGSGLLEVFSLMNAGSKNVVLLAADETVPEVFGCECGFPEFSFGAALLFSSERTARADVLKTICLESAVAAATIQRQSVVGFLKELSL